MVESENTGLKVFCNYCKNGVATKKVKCTECNSAFHPSCSIKKARKCCEKQNLIEETQINENEEAEESLTDKSMELENKLLKNMNRELKENNILLKEKNENLEVELASLRNTLYEKEQKITIQANINQKDLSDITKIIQQTFEGKFVSISEEINSLKLQITNKTSKTRQGQSLQSVNLNKNTMGKKHTDKNLPTLNQYSHVLQGPDVLRLRGPGSADELRGSGCSLTRIGDNVNTEESITQLKNVNENPCNTEEWKEVKRKKPIKKLKGEGEDEGKFKGGNSKVWLYLYKVKQDVEEEDILGYLKGRIDTENEEFIVKNLKTLEGSRFKEFMVAADFKYKNDFYNPKFWPKGVMFKRFDFKRYYEKFNIRDVISGGVEVDRPSSFLGSQNLTREVENT